MKPLFFLYVWLNLTHIAGLRKENLVKHIRKRTIQTGGLFFSSCLSSSLKSKFVCDKFLLSLNFDLNLFFIRGGDRTRTYSVETPDLQSGPALQLRRTPGTWYLIN